MKRLMIAFCCISNIVMAQNSTQATNSLKKDTIPNNIFTLGEVVVTGEKNKTISSSLSAQTLQDFAKNDVSKALTANGVQLDLTAQEKKDLIAFLHLLTDSTFITDKRFSNPFLNK